MKKILYTFLFSFLLMGINSQAQDILFQSYDDISTVGSWINSNAGTFSATQSIDAAEGSGSLALAYNLIGDQGWGGSVDFNTAADGGAFEDASEMEGLTFWYKVTMPASESASWNTKLFVNSAGDSEEWHASLGGVIEDTSGEWVQAKIPFTSYQIPSWLTTLDGVLYLDQISEIHMQIVTAEGSTTTGEILIDGLGAYRGAGTTAGDLIWDFENTGDITSSINSDGGSSFLTSSMDATQGDAATCLEYFLVADQSWGGSVDISMVAPNGVYHDMTEEDGIRFDYNVNSPATDGNGLQWNVKLFVNSTGGQEEWHALVGGNILSDDTGEWQEARINFSTFAIPSWLTSFDGVLYRDSIARIDMQVISNTVGMETQGAICLDNMTSYQDDAVLYDGYYLNDFDRPITAGLSGSQNSTDGSHTIYAGEAAAGDSSACVSYNLVGDQGWGGSIDLILTPANGGYIFQDMSEHLGVTFWYKNSTPASTPANVSFVLKTFEQGPEGVEEYQKSVGGIMADDSGEWTQVYVPFSDMIIPSWLPSYDGALQKDSIYQFVFQILGQEGTTTTGDICFDDFRSYDDEEVTELLDPPTSIIEISSTDINIFPNPTSSYLNVTGLDYNARIQIFDLSGSLIKSVMNESQIDIGELQSGYYLMKINSDDKTYSARIIKM